MENGGRYLLGTSWEEDSCTRCQCVAGRAHCQTYVCSITCSHPRKVPNLCCPICDGMYLDIGVRGRIIKYQYANQTLFQKSKATCHLCACKIPYIKRTDAQNNSN